MPLLHKTFRTIMENKAQYLGIFIMVLVSSMLLVGMTTVADNLGHIFDAFSAITGLRMRNSALTRNRYRCPGKALQCHHRTSCVADYESQPDRH